MDVAGVVERRRRLLLSEHGTRKQVGVGLQHRIEDAGHRLQPRRLAEGAAWRRAEGTDSCRDAKNNNNNSLQNKF